MVVIATHSMVTAATICFHYLLIITSCHLGELTVWKNSYLPLSGFNDGYLQQKEVEFSSYAAQSILMRGIIHRQKVQDQNWKG